MNHEVVNSNQNQDNDDMNHDVEDSNHRQPLSAGGGIVHDGQEDECVDSDLPFNGLDDDSLVEEMKDISQQQGKSIIQNDEYHQVKKVYRKCGWCRRGVGMGFGQGSGAVGWCYVCVRCESGFSV